MIPTIFENSYLQVAGELLVEGDAQDPAVFKPSDLFPNRAVVIDNRGEVSITHANLINLHRQVYDIPGVENRRFEKLDRVSLYRATISRHILVSRSGLGWWHRCYGPTFAAQQIIGSRLRRLGTESIYSTESDSVVSDAYAVSVYSSFSSNSGSIEWNTVEGSLIENTYMGSGSSDSDMPQLSNSVILNAQQRWANYYGDYVTKGTRLFAGHDYAVGKAQVAMIEQFDGKTYVLAWPDDPRVEYRYRITVKDARVNRARAFAQSLGGDLAVYSSDAEAVAIQQLGQRWTEASQRFADDEFISMSSELPLCQTQEAFCRAVVGDAYTYSNYIAIGVVADGDSWKWINGETPELTPSRDPTNEASPIPSSWEYQYANTGKWQMGYGYLSGGPSSMVLLEIPGTYSVEDIQQAWDSWRESSENTPLAGNAILNPWWDPVPNHWFVLASKPPVEGSFDLFEPRIDASNIFWGTESEELVSNAVVGFERDFNLLPIDYVPLASEPSSESYPFVSRLTIAPDGGEASSDNRFTSEPTIWTVEFNRDMDQTIQPMVTFGPDEPYTDFTVTGDWIDARTWEGESRSHPSPPMAINMSVLLVLSQPMTHGS